MQIELTMGDRNNLIKFGPEWLRNLSREGSATQGNASGSTPPNTAPGNYAGASANTQPKIHLAKLRYGREEILALYDRNVEPPAELKQFDALYNPRGKAPLALNTTFEEDMRDSMRSGGSSLGGMGERMGIGRGGAQQGDGRGRGRSSYTRLNSVGRGYKTGLSGPMGYPERGGDEPFEVPTNSNRAWGTNNGGNTPHRNGADPNAEWMQTNKAYRGGQRWQGHTNWRRPVVREEGEEWRATQDPNKARPSPQEKWERDWNERSERGQTSRDSKNQSWNTNRRTWGANEDNLPEWAVDNAETGGGTFDSSGAFHGFSNDDTNLPKLPVPDPVYPLTRSHTQGVLTRQAKVDEEGSDEWWASEKAKKLSPKRFDASEIKFKKQSNAPEGGQASERSSNEETQSKVPEKSEIEPNDSKSEEKFSKKVHYNRSLLESKTFDGANRSDVNLDEANDERGNFKSVIIAPNNILRTRHQNIVSSANEITRPSAQSVKSTPSGKSILQTATAVAGPAASAIESNNSKQKGSQEEKIVNDMMNFSIKEKDNMQQRPHENNRVGDMMGYTFSELEVASIPLPSTPKPAMPGLNVALPKGMPTSSPMSAMKSPGLHNIGVSNAGLVPGLSTADTSGLSTALYQSPGKQAGPMGPSISSYGNVGLSKMGLGSPAMGNSANHTLGNSPHGGLGNIAHGGLGNAGLGKTAHVGIGNAGLGNSAYSAHNNPVHPGHGNTQHSSLASSPHSGLGNMGLGNSGHPGLGNAGLGSPHVGLRNSPHSGLGNVAHLATVGLGHSAHPGLGTAGLGLQFGTASSSLGLSTSPLSGSTAAPGAALSFSNTGPNSAGKNSLYNSNIGVSQTKDMNGPQAKTAVSSMFHMRELPPPPAQGGFGGSVYGSVQQPPPPQTEMWYYEDPNKNIQGPFSSKEMYHWYRAGFFTSSLMVRRACDTHMQPLGSFGPVAPFAMDLLQSSFSNRLDGRPQSSHDSILNQQSSLGLGNDAMNQMNLNEPALDNMQFGTVGNNFIRNTSFSQQPMDTLWSQSATVGSDLWLQPPASQNRSDPQYQTNNLNMFIWEQQATVVEYGLKSSYQEETHALHWELQKPSVIASNSLLPEEIAKEMKTEDQILAQIRGSQTMANNRTVPFVKQETQSVSVASVLSKPEEAPAQLGATPDLGELEKLIQKETLSAITPHSDASLDNLSHFLSTHDKKNLNEESNQISNVNSQNNTVLQQQQKNQSDAEKTVVKKDTTSAKKKKSKDEPTTDLKKEEHCNKNERAQEAAMFYVKKEEKASKKEMEKEKKEWIKEGFTIVKGQDKSAYKDKKKVDEFKAMEEIEKRRKEEQNFAEKEKKKIEILKRPGAAAAPGHGRHMIAEVGGGAVRKAPWSAVSAQGLQAPTKDGLTLAEIQRLEREKKLDLMKEQQQQMMQMLAQQHEAQLAREQELSQNVIGWAKKKSNAPLPTSLSLAEIQAETRKQAAAAAALAAAEAAELAVNQALDQGAPPPALPPWKATPNERPKKNKQSAVSEKKEESKPAEPKMKKKTAAAQAAAAACAAVTVSSTGAIAKTGVKKELSPALEFETWCNQSLSAWTSKIDVPTFVGFLKDIESPYEVKDYVKCYLGETKDSNDFARHFLERRCKLLRASTVTPVDDLASPAAAITPRGGLDFTEGKGKKPKKNKMLKVDARILGFSVTASEDRINVGDIDTA